MHPPPSAGSGYKSGAMRALKQRPPLPGSSARSDPAASPSDAGPAALLLAAGRAGAGGAGGSPPDGDDGADGGDGGDGGCPASPGDAAWGGARGGGAKRPATSMSPRAGGKGPAGSPKDALVSFRAGDGPARWEAAEGPSRPPAPVPGFGLLSAARPGPGAGTGTGTGPQLAADIRQMEAWWEGAR